MSTYLHLRLLLIPWFVVSIAGVTFSQLRTSNQDVAFTVADSKVSCPTDRFVIRPDNQGHLDFDSTLAQQLQQVLNINRASYMAWGGYSAAVLVPGKGMWLGVSGVDSPDMLFCIASNSKTFTAALTLKLMEEGLLSLDDSLGKFLPPMQNINGAVTIRQLLNMTSGFSCYFNDGTALNALHADPDRYWPPEELISTFVGSPKRPPGQFWYANTNTILVGMVLKAVTQSTVSMRLREKILDPLGLEHTFLPPDDSLAAPVAHSYDYSGADQYVKVDSALFSMAWTAGGMFSTAEDMARWTAALYGGQVLLPSTMEQMQAYLPMQTCSMFPSLDFPAGFSIREYGLGVANWYLYGKQLRGHSGAEMYYLSMPTFHSASGISIVLLTNHFRSFDAILQPLAGLWEACLRAYDPTVAPAPEATLYAFSGTNTSGHLHTVNPATGAHMSVGPTQFGTIVSAAVYPLDSVSACSGKLFGISRAGGAAIVLIDPVTGEAWPRFALPFSSTIVGGMAFTKDGELVLSVKDGRLYRVDISSGDTTLITRAAVGFSSLAVNSRNGELWGVRWDNFRDKLYGINLTTGDTTFKGVTGFSPPIAGLAFDHLGNLFAVISHSGDPDTLIRVDTGTGTGTLIGSLGMAGVTAIAFSPLTTGVEERPDVLPKEFVLEQNYPNPFNPTATITYELPKASEVRLNVYDVLGRDVAVLVNEKKDAGAHTVRFDGSNLASGVYFYRLQAGSYVETKKLLLVR